MPLPSHTHSIMDSYSPTGARTYRYRRASERRVKKKNTTPRLMYLCQKICETHERSTFLGCVFNACAGLPVRVGHIRIDSTGLATSMEGTNYLFTPEVATPPETLRAQKDHFAANQRGPGYAHGKKILHLRARQIRTKKTYKDGTRQDNNDKKLRHHRPCERATCTRTRTRTRICTHALVHVSTQETHHLSQKPERH